MQETKIRLYPDDRSLIHSLLVLVRNLKYPSTLKRKGIGPLATIQEVIYKSERLLSFRLDGSPHFVNYTLDGIDYIEVDCDPRLAGTGHLFNVMNGDEWKGVRQNERSE